MRIPFRAALAACLFLIAAWPITLILVAESAPVRAVRMQLVLEDLAGKAGLALAALGMLALVLYPPFLPWLALGFRRLKKRLSISRLPTQEALERLKHFESAAEHLNAGRGLLAEGRPREAVPHLVRTVELDPTDLRARYELALALLQLGSVKEAEALLAQVVEREPEHAFGDALLRLADVRLRLGATQPAAEALERFVARYGKKREALVYLARALRALGRHDEARAALAEGARPLAKEELRDPHHRYWRAKAKVASWLGGAGA